LTECGRLKPRFLSLSQLRSKDGGRFLSVSLGGDDEEGSRHRANAPDRAPR
jgi:hypothetical protein